MHAAPTVSDNRIFVVTVDNELVALSAEDGQRQWSHNGIPETAGLLGSASPAVEGEIVVVAYNSGELFALRVENGRAVWSENLAASRTADAVPRWPTSTAGRSSIAAASSPSAIAGG
jgi:outer membrane protein assembly factor BamB